MNHTVWLLVDVLTNLGDSVVMLLFMMALFKGREFYQKRPWLYAFGIALISFLVLRYTDSRMVNIILYIAIFGCIHLLFKGPIHRKVLAWLALLVVLIIIENLVLASLMITLDKPVSVFANNTSYRMTGMLLSKSLGLLFSFWFYRRKEEKMLDLRLDVKLEARYLTLIIGFFVLIILMMSMLFKIYEMTEMDSIYIDLLTIASILECVLVIGIYFSLLNQARRQMEMSLLHQQKDMQLKHFNAVELSLEELRRLRHDFSNHLTVMDGLLALNKLGDLENYLGQLMSPIGKVRETDLSKNTALAALLYSKLLVARQEGIEVHYDIEPGHRVEVEDVDFVILVGNLMDNAIEASRYVEEGKKEIRIRIASKGVYLVFDCSNRMKADNLKKENGRFKTIKKDQQAHGIGLRNVETVIDKYSGHIEMKIQEDFFIVHTSLYNKKPEAAPSMEKATT